MVRDVCIYAVNARYWGILWVIRDSSMCDLGFKISSRVEAMKTLYGVKKLGFLAMVVIAS